MGEATKTAYELIAVLEAEVKDLHNQIRELNHHLSVVTSALAQLNLVRGQLGISVGIPTSSQERALVQKVDDLQRELASRS